MNDNVSSGKISEISYQYWKLHDTVSYTRVNQEARALAIKNKDTFALADTHWNDANIYKKKEVYDSAYYHYNKAYEYFEAVKEYNNSARMLYGMAFIKGRYRDYTGSEILIFKAISRFEKLEKYRNLYSCYNYLALLQRDIGNYDKALNYHKTGQKYIQKIKSKTPHRLIWLSLNNIGLVYTDKGDYGKAIDCFDRVLGDDRLESEDTEHYARVIDNKAYCQLLMRDTTGILNDFYSSLKIRSKLDNKDGIVICKLHIAEYFKYANNTKKALKYALEARYLAKEIRNSRDYLEALIMLSDIDSVNSTDYLRTYLSYNDSILNVERTAINKFTRISYETDQYIEANKRLNERNKWMMVCGLAILAIFSLIYYIRIQRVKNKNLLLEADQQKINEENYLLTIRQQFKLEEEKRNERNRISAELHDGVLSDLYGIRMQLGFMKLKGESSTVKKFETFLNELQRVESEIREVSHKLNSEEAVISNNFNSLLKNLLEAKKLLGQFEYRFDADDGVNWNRIHDEIKINIYRISQELIQNVIKHSDADTVVLDFKLTATNTIKMTLKDNGTGFDSAIAGNGIGLKNIKSRIKKLNGSMKIKSTLGKGTKIIILIPLKYN